MASRAQQKAQARAERLAREQAAAAAAARRQRLQLLGGVIVVAIAVVVVVVVISSKSSGAKAVAPHTPAALAADKRVDALLSGIPQSSDNVLGNSKAPVTITEYGDLECSVCDDFALATTTHIATPGYGDGSGLENQVIDKLVRTGKAKLVYDDLETATGSGATPNMFETQQAAAFSAGLQDLGWYYIELFYNEQGAEGTDYVTQSYLDGLAKQVPGLNYSKWLTDIKDPSIVSQVSTDDTNGTKLDLAAGASGASTPTLVVSGPKGTKTLTPGLPSSYGEIASAVKSVQ